MAEKKISRVSALQAAAEGGKAARDGAVVTDCPYTGPEQVDRYLAHYWMRGHAQVAEPQPAT